MVREYKGRGGNTTRRKSATARRGNRHVATSKKQRMEQERTGVNRQKRVHAEDIRKKRKDTEINNQTERPTKRISKFSDYMQKKLFVLLLVFLFCFAFLGFRLYKIVTEKGDTYTRKILSQQYYSSKTLPYKRGDIVDKNGTILATSDKVYNVILDTVALNENEEFLNPTLDALVRCFGVDKSEIKTYMSEYPTSRYKILKKQCTYDEISAFLALQDEEQGELIQGIWFEDQYVRNYPYGTLACDVIGFTNNDQEGTYGLEEYYNESLSGSAGREYGYLNDDSTLERTTIAAVDGYTIETTLDMNIQRIVEKNLQKFNDEHENEYRDGLGAYNIGCIVMECDTGNILAMASYPNFDLNDPYDLSMYYSEEAIQEMKDNDTYYATLNQLWRNFCISDAYEPGSVAKPFTVAAAIDCGAITGNESFECYGSLSVAGSKPIGCHNRYGDGVLTVQQAVEQSCNVALMQIAAITGKQNYLKYFRTFGFGLRTGVDLAGEARTASLVFNESTMGPVELATSSFGQGFNVTMIQMIAAYNSLINGGFYYEPHMVSAIRTDDGAIVDTIEPRILHQTISADTSALIRQYCVGVVQNGTGKNARPAGYMIGGKTGTAETVQNGVRDKTNYVVSFMGFAPADDPQICIYVVVDRPNVQYQANATRYATFICKDVLTEVLPYLGIYMTEEISEKEQAELDELGIYIPQTSLPSKDSEEDTLQEEGDGTNKNGAAGEGTSGDSTSGDSTSRDITSG